MYYIMYNMYIIICKFKVVQWMLNIGSLIIEKHL